jgi:ankyrin repeat protein
MRRTTAWLIVVGMAGLTGSPAWARDLRLIDAARHADGSTVRALLQQRADVTAAEGDGTTALHWAAYRDNLEIADLLIRAGARVNAANDLGATPLWAACENGSAAMVRRLLQAGGNPNMALASGETPLMTAARTGNVEVVRQLLAKGAEVNAKERAHHQTALMWAVAQRHAEVVGVLLAHGADFRAGSTVRTEVVKTSLDPFNPNYTVDIPQGGYTALLFAARVGDLTSAKLLVGAGADVNDTAPYGTSALVVAAHSGHGELAAFLLQNGADSNAGAAGYTALHAALLHKDERLVAALLAHGANPNARLERATPTRRDSVDFFLPPAFVGATPFWLAARYSTAPIMRLLATHGADPLAVHHVEYWAGAQAKVPERPFIREGAITALMAAVGMGGRAPLFAVNRLDRIAENAPAGGRREADPAVVEAAVLAAATVAVELGVDVNAANAEGNTALHAAAVRGFDSIVTWLVERGARLDLRNKKGQSPLAATIAATGQGPGTSSLKSTIELLRRFGRDRVVAPAPTGVLDPGSRIPYVRPPNYLLVKPAAERSTIHANRPGE